MASSERRGVRSKRTRPTRHDEFRDALMPYTKRQRSARETTDHPPERYVRGA